MSMIRKYTLVLIPTVFLAGCVTTTVGTGDIEVSGRCAAHFQTYKTTTNVGVFTMSDDGRYCHYTYCRDPSGMCVGNMPAQAIANCEKRGDRECFIFAEDHRIIWDGKVTFRGSSYPTTQNSGRDPKLNDSLPELEIRKPVNRNDRRLLSNPPDDKVAAFTVDENGDISNGPRLRAGGSIDYTTLVRNQVILEIFQKIAFRGGELQQDRTGDEAEGDRRIKKYNGPVRLRDYAYDASTQLASRKIIEKVLREIRVRSDLDIKRIGKNEGDFQLILFALEGRSDAERWEEELIEIAEDPDTTVKSPSAMRSLSEHFKRFADAGNLNCIVSPAVGSNEVMRTAFITIDVTVPKQILETCYFEEIVQALGLYRDDDSYFNSLFTDSYKYYRKPTGLDWLMLKILYDDRLKHGMEKEEAMPIAREILTELRPWGWESGS